MSRRSPAAQHGFSMVAVMWVLLATTMLTGAVFKAVGGDIPLARAAEDRKQAYAAAEAGLEYYLYQLTRDNEYWAKCDSVPAPAPGQVAPINQRDPATRRWQVLAGSAARFSIELLPANGAPECLPASPEDTMLDKAGGTFRIRSTGESRGVRRSIVATFRRSSFLDYLYFTDYETLDPLTFSTITTQEYAQKNCMRYRSVRNRNEWCRTNTNITFPTWDKINGPLHTNDDLSICGTPTFGRSNQDRIEIAGPAPNGWTGSDGDGCAGEPKFVGTVRHPAPTLPIPTSNTRLRQAALPGYIFSGRTRIVFTGTGTMQVTNAAGATSTMAPPSNGVIYVQKNGSCGIDPPREVNNYEDPGDNGCAILTVRGVYQKSMTLGAEDDIIIDGNLTRQGDVVLGLIAQRFVRIKHPVVRKGNACENAASGVLTDVTVQAAILALNDSFVADNYACGVPLGTLNMEGAIAQRFRGPVGTFNSATGAKSTGYTKNYTYDDRLRYRSPPFFLDPISAAWRPIRASEQVPAPAA